MENGQRSFDNSFIPLKPRATLNAIAPQRFARTNSLNGRESGRAIPPAISTRFPTRFDINTSSCIFPSHFSRVYAVIIPSVRPYPAAKLVHLALHSFLLTLRAETSRWKRIAFRPTVFPLTKVILMGRKRRQSARLLQSAVPDNELRMRDKSNRDENRPESGIAALHLKEPGRAHVPHVRGTRSLRPNAFWFRGV